MPASKILSSTFSETPNTVPQNPFIHIPVFTVESLRALSLPVKKTMCRCCMF